MSLHTFTITSQPKKMEALKVEIIKLLTQGNRYILNFPDVKPEDEVINDDSKIVINAEYPIVAEILVKIGKEYENFKFGVYDAQSIQFRKWMIIEEENE